MTPAMFQRRSVVFLLAGLVLVAASLACGAGAAPEAAAPEMTSPVDPAEPEAPPSQTREPAPPGTLPTSTSASQGDGLQPAIPESRRLTLEFPPVMRTGDSTRIRLQLEVDDLGKVTPTAVIGGNEVRGETVEIPNLYETHNVVAEARLDMAGMEVQPSGTISEPLTQGQAATFYWSVRPNDPGTYEGTAWLHLRFVPKGGGDESRIPVSIQFLEIEARSFFGFLNGNLARGIGALGSVVGGVLGFPFADDLLKWAWRRIRGGS